MSQKENFHSPINYFPRMAIATGLLLLVGVVGLGFNPLVAEKLLIGAGLLFIFGLAVPALGIFFICRLGKSASNINLRRKKHLEYTSGDVSRMFEVRKQADDLKRSGQPVDLMKLAEREFRKGREHYFFDLIELAKRREWSFSDDDLSRTNIKGSCEDMAFEIEAVLNDKFEEIAIIFPAPKSDKISFTSGGSLPAWVWEKIVVLPEGVLNGVTLTGNVSSEFMDFVKRNRYALDELFNSKICIAQLELENGQMVAAVFSDSEGEGRTSIDLLVRKLAMLAKDLNGARS